MVGQVRRWSLFFLLILAQFSLAQNERRRKVQVVKAVETLTCGSVLAEKSEKTRALIGNDDDFFVFDTNVLINDPGAFLRYRGTIVIPWQVLEELDGLKNKDGVGHTSREALRSLDSLRKTGTLDDKNDVVYKTSNGTNVRFWQNPDSSQEKAQGDSMDDQIVSAAVGMAKMHPNKTWLISDDNGVLLRADILGRPYTLKLSRFAPDRLVEENAVAHGYSGLRELIVPSEVYQRINDTKSFKPSELLALIGQDAYFPPLRPNEGVAIQAQDGASPIQDVDTGLKCPFFRYQASTGQLIAIPKGYELKKRGMIPRNLEQRLGFDLAFDPDVKYLMLSGEAGSGKNIISLLAGVEQVDVPATERRNYREILFLRSTTTIGEDIGALPGTESEKMLPHMKAVSDTLAAIEEAQAKDKSGQKEAGKFSGIRLYERLREQKKLINDQATQFMRGSTIRNTLIIIDEAQNFTPKQLDSLIDRTGPGSKIIILGDPAQVDSRFLNHVSNGMAVKLRDVEVAFESLPPNGRVGEVDLSILATVRLWRSERSDVARANLHLKNQRNLN